jgi:hypothetical protein
MLTIGLRATDRLRENSIQHHLISYFFRQGTTDFEAIAIVLKNQFHTVLSVICCT